MSHWETESCPSESGVTSCSIWKENWTGDPLTLSAPRHTEGLLLDSIYVKATLPFPWLFLIHKGQNIGGALVTLSFGLGPLNPGLLLPIPVPSFLIISQPFLSISQQGPTVCLPA